MLLVQVVVVVVPPAEGAQLTPLLPLGPTLPLPTWEVVAAKEVEEELAAAAPQESSLLLQLLLERRFCLE